MTASTSDKEHEALGQPILPPAKASTAASRQMQVHAATSTIAGLLDTLSSPAKAPQPQVENKSEWKGDSFFPSTKSTDSAATISTTVHRALDIDIAALRSRILEITHLDIQKIVTETVEAFEKRAKAFNENIQNPLMKEKDWREEMTELENLITNSQAQINRTNGDHTSIRRAQVLFDHIKAACDECKAQWFPSSASRIKLSILDWQAHRLRMEQELLLNAPLRQLFNAALEKIAAKARLDHKIPKGIFICYAKPHEEETHLQWVVPFLDRLRSHLHRAGFSRTKLDTKDNAIGETKHTYLKGIETDDFVLLIGTPTLRQQQEAEEPALLAALEYIERKVTNDKGLGRRNVFPLLIYDTMESSFPARYASYKPLDLSHTSQKSYFQQLCGLIAHLYGMAEEAAFAEIWEEFLVCAEMSQKGARLVLTHRLSQERIIEQLAIEQAQQTEENKEQGEAERKLLAGKSSERKEVKRHVDAEELKQTYAEAMTDSWHLPPRNDHYFTGRIAELKKLNETFVSKKETKAMILSAVSGLGGVGKTQLAIYHLHHPEHPYALRIWFQAETDTILHKEYLEFAKHYKLPLEEKAPRAEVIQAVKLYLAKQPSWLAIYDNAGNYQEVKDFLLDELNNGHRVITTRRTEWHGKGSKLEVNIFSEAEATAYIKKVLQRGDTLVEAEENTLITLVRELGCLPLALAQAGAYIETNGILVSDYLQLYRQSAIEMLKDTTLPLDSNIQPVAITWDISLKAIQVEEQKAGDPLVSLPVLQAISYLAPDHILRSLLERWLTQNLFIKGDQVAGLQFNKAVKRLLAYSMIQAHLEQKTLSVHRLVQEVVRFQLQPPKQTAPSVTSLESKGDAKSTPSAEPTIHSFLLASLTDSSLEEFHLETQVLVDEKRQKLLLPHLQALVKHHDASQNASAPHSADLARLLGSIGNMFNIQLGDAGQAKLYYERALKIFEQHYDKDHCQMAIALNNLANSYGDLGDASTKKLLLERALKIDEQRYGKDHLQVAITLNNLANAYGDLGDASTKKLLLERVLQIQEQHYVKEHWQVGMTLEDLGTAYADLGEVAKAKQLFERALKIKEQHYGKEHWQVANTLNNLASLYEIMGKMSTAKQLFECALKIKVQYYGKDHWQVAITLNNLANTYQQFGDISKALSYAQQAYRIFTGSFKNLDHPYIKKAEKNLKKLQPLLSMQQHLCQPIILELLQQGDRETARYYFENEQVNIDDSDIHIYLAGYYSELKHFLGATVHLNQALTLARQAKNSSARLNHLHGELACAYLCYHAASKQNGKPITDQEQEQAQTLDKQHFEATIQGVVDNKARDGSFISQHEACYAAMMAQAAEGNLMAVRQVLENYLKTLSSPSVKFDAGDAKALVPEVKRGAAGLLEASASAKVSDNPHRFLVSSAAAPEVKMDSQLSLQIAEGATEEEELQQALQLSLSSNQKSEQDKTEETDETAISEEELLKGAVQMTFAQ